MKAKLVKESLDEKSKQIFTREEVIELLRQLYVYASSDAYEEGEQDPDEYGFDYYLDKADDYVKFFMEHSHEQVFALPENI